MTGRKWESEASDASRYCQITKRMHQISLFLHLVLVISLASFSSLISLGWRYAVGCLINITLGMKRNYHRQNTYECEKEDLQKGNRSYAEYYSFGFNKESYSCLVLEYLQLLYQFYAFLKVTPSAQMDVFKKNVSLSAEENNSERMNQGTREEKTPSAQINYGNETDYVLMRLKRNHDVQCHCHLFCQSLLLLLSFQIRSKWEMNSITPGYGNPACNEFHLKICFST